MLHTLYNHCKSVISCFEEHESIALDKINRMRCPLSFADSELYERMEEAISEYCEENGLNAEDFDTEEVFWAGEE